MTRREAVVGGLLVPVCAGLTGAALNVLWYLAHRYLLHDLVFNGLDAVWLQPCAYVILALVPGIPLALLLVAWPRPRLWQLLVFGCGWAVIFCVGLLFRQMSSWATLILSAGAASRIAVLAGREPAPWIPRLRRASLALLSIPVLGLILSRGAPPLVERWRTSHLAAAPAGAPNVLWVVIDAQRAQNLDLYGYGRRTGPELDTLAASSTVFDWAIAPAPWTLASHAAMFSGRPASQLSVRWFHPFTDPVPRIAQVMREHGFRTAGFSANISYAGPASGLERGFTRYSTRPLNLGRVIRAAPIWNTPTGVAVWKARGWTEVLAALRPPKLARSFFPEGRYRPAENIGTLFLDWQRQDNAHPFFAFLNFLDVHEHHTPRTARPEVVHGADLNEAGYDDAMVYDDSVIGAIVDSLSARHLLDHTLLIVSSDHGEQFNEHGLRGHSNSLYSQLLRVPLVIRLPGVVPAGLRVPTTVSTRDLAATIVDLTGLHDARIPGQSIADAWRHPGAPRDAALSEVEGNPMADANSPTVHGPVRSLMDDTWHFIDAPDSDALYLYRADPGELKNLVHDSATAAVVARLRSQLRRIPFGYPTN